MTWLLSDLRNTAIAALLAFCAFHLIWTDPALRRDRDQADAARDKAVLALKDERAAHQATIANHKAAAQAASAAQAANLVRVDGDQTAINERVQDDHQARLSDLRARASDLASRLRAEGGSGVSSSARLPASGPPAGRAAQAPHQAGLPLHAACEPLTLDERLIASEQALQLDALIDWAEAQAAVRTAL